MFYTQFTPSGGPRCLLRRAQRPRTAPCRPQSCVSHLTLTFHLTPNSCRQQVLDAHRSKSSRLIQRCAVLEALFGLQARHIPCPVLWDPCTRISGIIRGTLNGFQEAAHAPKGRLARACKASASAIALARGCSGRAHCRRGLHWSQLSCVAILRTLLTFQAVSGMQFRSTAHTKSHPHLLQP